MLFPKNDWVYDRLFLLELPFSLASHWLDGVPQLRRIHLNTSVRVGVSLLLLKVSGILGAIAIASRAACPWHIPQRRVCISPITNYQLPITQSP
ncbi:hypothetical protein [Microseira wollei]|uniref:Uncharacterized protein n=1 Tax=Microseira wollei NIES-4236 TaxID=2530354 RepID=A0AAV3X9Z6_9CYAN|nr:hypothetical protein [Microseira wollei]GET36910.1 hypothetical protein MiSe_16620 [Microseira wollei NIES-4236]